MGYRTEEPSEEQQVTMCVHGEPKWDDRYEKIPSDTHSAAGTTYNLRQSQPSLVQGTGE